MATNVGMSTREEVAAEDSETTATIGLRHSSSTDKGLEVKEKKTFKSLES